MPDLKISEASVEDFDALGMLMFRAVREGTSPYSEAQRAAWMPAPRSGTEWNARLSSQYVLKAQSSENDAFGFMTLRPDGYVDFAYILPDARGQGLFRRLYAQIESYTKDKALTGLFTHASQMAMPAFAAVGFVNPMPETVTVNGQSLSRFEMSKRLP